MAVQARRDNATTAFILSGISLILDGVTLLQDAGRVIALAAYTLLSKILMALPTTGTADGGNTGNGTVTGVDFAPGTLPKLGEYVLTCVTKVATGGVFKLEDPDGNILVNDLTITLTAATTFIVNIAGMTFIITPGGTDFEVDDFFVIEATSVDKWVPYDPAAVNGAQIPKGIYLGADITAADIAAGDVPDLPVLVGASCTIDKEQLIIEESATLDTVLVGGKTIREALSEIGIFAEDTVQIDEYENA